MATQPLSAPYPHQTEAVQAVLSAFESQDRAHIVMACGTGKTRAALWIAEALDARRIVIFAPSLALINQFIKEWLSVSQSTKKACLAVCSDETVAKNLDLCVLDPRECACPVTTNPKDVRQFLEKKKNQVQWIFCTYHSSGVLAEAMKDYPCDLGIFDEAHRTVNSEQFGMALIDEKVPIKKRLFMTATPKHYDIETRNKEEDAKLVYSMDDESIYGPRAYTLPFRKAIDLGLITDYKVIVSVIDSPNTLTDDNFYSAVALALNKAFDQAPSVSKMVSFHRTIEDAQLFKEHLTRHEELKGFKPLHVNGFLKTELRKQTMDLFKLSSKAIVTNARCLTEGIDMPTVDMVVFLNKKRSKIDIVQAIGRCLRKSPGKTYGYIFLPLFLANDQEEGLEAGVERTDYREVWEVIQALSEQDEDLHATILDLKSNQGKRKALGSRLEKYIEIVANPALNDAHYQELKEVVSIKIIDKIGSIWDEMYAKLCAFKKKYGHYNIASHLTNDKSFLRWVWRTRYHYRNKSLAEHKAKLLESIGFAFYPIDLIWENHFQELKAYQQEYGHCNIPRELDTTLAGWVVHQKVLYNCSKLEDFKVQQLNSLGLALGSSIREVRWNQYFQQLKDYKKQHGNCNAGCKHPALQSWIGIQRRLYRQGSLTSHRIKLLNRLGFEWEPRINKWKKNFEVLKAYHEENGHCKIPKNEPRYLSLKTWLKDQIKLYKNGTLEPARIELLESLKFSFPPLSNE